MLRGSLDNAVILPGSDAYDTLTCGCLMDADLDGELEMLVGTYTRLILVYKFDLATQAFQLKETIPVSSPVYGLAVSDVNQDGLLELVVSSFEGTHVFRPSMDAALRRVRG